MRHISKENYKKKMQFGKFVKDIFHNLMDAKARRRYSTSTKSLYEMINYGEALDYIGLLA